MLPENIGMVLYLECYQKGLRSVKDINKKLTDRYHQPINMNRREICGLLEKRAQMFASEHFNPGDIVE